MLKSRGSRTIGPMLLLAGALAAGAPAGDYYVDGTNGSNSGGNGSRQAPWKTITFALGRIPPPPPSAGHTLHVLDGIYDNITGETFPIVVPPGIRLVGTGPAKAIVFGPGKPGVPLFRFTGAIDQRSFMTGLGLHSGDPAIHIAVDGGHGVGPIVRACRIAFNGEGVHVDGPPSGTSAPVVELCSIENNSTGGVRLVGTAGGTLGGELRANRVDQNSGHGLSIEGAAGAVVTVVENCTLISNTADGLKVLGGATTQPVITHVTSRSNGGAGLRLVTGSAANLRVRNSIFYGNQTDLVDVPAAAVVYCCFKTTSGANPPRGNQNGNLQVDPLFQQPDEPDLGPFSPLIDQASYQASLDPPVDFTGDPRNTDGNGDSVHGPDIGADEYMPLYASGLTMPGGITYLNVDLPTNRSIPYYLGISFTRTGIPVAGRRVIPLWPDPLLALALSGQLPWVSSFSGTMNGSGFGRGRIQWPADPGLRGLTFHVAAITLQGGYPGGIRCVTNGVALTLL